MAWIHFTLMCWICGSYGRRVQVPPNFLREDHQYLHKDAHSLSNAFVTKLLALSPSAGLGATGSRRSEHYQRSHAAIKLKDSAVVRDEISGNPIVLLPRVLYTVPSQVIGWKGRPHLGENASLWYDSLGVRQGPTPNYWRQDADERGYRRPIEAISSILCGDFANESKLLALETDQSIRYPDLNRKLLGEWLPLVAQGQRVARAAGGGLAVPAVISICRAGGRKTQEHGYGTLDLHLEDGELLSIRVSSLSNPDVPSIEGTFAAGVPSSRREVRFDLDGAESSTFDWFLEPSGVMEFGGVTFLSDYLMVQRSPSGELSNLYLRRDVRGHQADTPFSPLSGDDWLDLEGTVERSRQDRVRFRSQYFDALARLKVDLPEILVQDPHWENFADDFQLVDATSGVSLKGLSAAKELLKILQSFHIHLQGIQSPLKDEFNLLSMEVRRPPHRAEWRIEVRGCETDEISYDKLCAIWGKYLGHMPLPSETSEAYGLPLEISGVSTFTFNSEGNINGLIFNSLSLNGHVLKLPHHSLPDYSERIIGPEDVIALRSWVESIFHSLPRADASSSRASELLQTSA